jgi:hypothetical protein
MHRNTRIAATIAGTAALLALACSDSPTDLSRGSALQFASEGSGAIWTTTGSCGAPQDANHYSIGDQIFLNGSGFEAGSYPWSIVGRPGGASADPGQTVASGNVSPDGAGNFCFAAYQVLPDDRGEYQVKVGTKGDNYRVEGGPFLEVSKTAVTSFGRTYEWDIVKSAASSVATMTPTQTLDQGYSVTVSANFTDGDWKVSGVITVANTGNEAANVTGVSDLIEGALSATVDCGDFPKSVAVDAQFTCTYEYTFASNPGTDSLTNVATATEGSLGDFTGSVKFAFSTTPSTETDECIALTDDKYAAINQTICYSDLVNGSKVIGYVAPIGPFGNDVCTGISWVNTAAIETNDSQTTESSSATVEITGDCPEGCTLTQGYWKTHGTGSKHYDEVWASVGGSDAIFLHGLTYAQVLKTPVAGNAWYQLAHQYIAATLNVNGGANSVALGTTLTDALTLLESHDPVVAVSKSQKSAFTTLAGILASYNEGVLLGAPAHCSE